MPNIPISRTITRFCDSYSMIFGRKPASADADLQWKSEKCLSTMRQSFHRALTTCRAPLPPGKKYVGVQFLTKELIFYVVDAKGKGQEIFDDASKHLGLLDAELFGLAFYQDGDYIFIDLNLKVSKYAVKSWKTHSNGVGGDGQPLLILHMRVKYYVDCHLLINEKVVRHHYYLQLRENIKSYKQPIGEEKSFLLAALALQADLGNYNEEKHKDGYFEISNYFPSWIVKKIGEDYIIKNIPALHKDNAGLSRGEAQVGYIKEASDLTAPHNLHFYKMRRKKGKVWGDVWLGIGDGGIHIYEEIENTKSLLSTFLWSNIAKLHFEKKKFEILSEGSPDYRRFTYFVQSEELAKHLLWICRMTHHFHMANQSRVADLKKLELDGGKQYRESYIYTDEVDQAREQKQNTLQKYKLKSKVGSSTMNLNGNEERMAERSMKPTNVKMSGMPWDNTNSLENGECVSQHHSMESLPLTNGCKFSSELKYKSQSIPCLPERTLTAYPETVDSSSSSSQLWCPPSQSSVSTTPNSTLMSRSSCTDSTCSSLSLTSGSTLKVGSDWVKCDSFEELPLMQKLCISTFMDKKVRTASVYDATGSTAELRARENGTLDIRAVKMPSYSLVRASSVDEVAQTPESPSSSAESARIEEPPSKLVKGRSCSLASLPVSPTTISASSSPEGKVSSKKPPVKTPSFNAPSSSKTPPQLVDYSTSSLGTPASSKIVDVKRSPSFNACSTDYSRSRAIAKKPARQYATNAQFHTPSRPRIGVSSLSRDQKLPLALFDNRRMLAAGSEPNLYVPVHDRSPTDKTQIPSRYLWLQRHLNSRSEMSLNVLDSNPQLQQSQVLHSKTVNGGELCDSRNRQLSLPDVCSEVQEGEFPFIPPPPAYRNEAGNGFGNSNKSSVKPPIAQHSEKTNLMNGSAPDVLDLHQLRQRSRDLDLPLISALCNDRSLLMLPKTVPTCSRQRHRNRDRFGRTTSLPDGDPNGPFPPGGRPVSWHVDSARVPGTVKPCSASWDYGVQVKGVPEPRMISVGAAEILRSHAYSLDTGVQNVGVVPPHLQSRTVENGVRSNPLLQHPDLVQKVLQQHQAQKPRTFSLDNGVQSHGMLHGLHSRLAQSQTFASEHCVQNVTVVGGNGVTKPRTFSLDNGVRSHVLVGPNTGLPPTILTSFVKTPVKQYRNVHPMHSDKSQMIPMKLRSMGWEEGFRDWKGS